ncbi:MAG: class I SAM-dependent methyltransferase [Prochlorococcaceae cyanobacterium]
MVALDIDAFLHDGFALREHLSAFLKMPQDALEARMAAATEALAQLQPTALDASGCERFYESDVGTGHLYELAGWHLQSADYIADTLRVQMTAAHGDHLDFGGGIGSHALAAAALPRVRRVWMVDLNGSNREFVAWRAQRLGLQDRIVCCRDLSDAQLPRCFDSLTCLDVLEHVPDPAALLAQLADRLSAEGGVALLNWYFFKGFQGEYPFHIDDPTLVQHFFEVLQERFLERFHPYLITARTYTLRTRV